MGEGRRGEGGGAMGGGGGGGGLGLTVADFFGIGGSRNFAFSSRAILFATRSGWVDCVSISRTPAHGRGKLTAENSKPRN